MGMKAKTSITLETDLLDRIDLALINANAAALNKEAEDDLELVFAIFQEHGETRAQAAP